MASSTWHARLTAACTAIPRERRRARIRQHGYRRCSMAKVLKCGEVFSGCDTVIYGKDEDEVLAKEEAHARTDHNMTMIPMDTINEMASHIREGAEPRRRWFGLRS